MLALPLQLSITFVVAVLLSCSITVFVRAFAQRFSIVDIPNEDRKIHHGPIPLLGGIALYLTVSLCLLGLVAVGWLTDNRVSPQLLTGVLLAGAVIMVGGYLDDRYNLSWRGQIIFPLTLAVTYGAP